MDTRDLLVHLEAGALTVDEVMREIGSPVTSDDVERAATLAWNEAVEKAAAIADEEAALDDGGEKDAESRGNAEVAMRFKCRAVAARAIAGDIRALKRTT